jgi:hypothetical protein
MPAGVGEDAPPQERGEQAMIDGSHEWKTCGCINCQSLRHEVETAREEGAEVMRDKILALAKQFGVPGMAMTVLKGLPLPEKKFK